MSLEHESATNVWCPYSVIVFKSPRITNFLLGFVSKLHFCKKLYILLWKNKHENRHFMKNFYHKERLKLKNQQWPNWDTRVLIRSRRGPNCIRVSQIGHTNLKGWPNSVKQSFNCKYSCITVECDYNAVQYNMILHTAPHQPKQNINQSLQSQKTTHTWLS